MERETREREREREKKRMEELPVKEFVNKINCVPRFSFEL